ncbi:hypothetical protein BGZ60DRAFT_457848 [Tricladium varicosporioides]|nr:hypothetical protein BGZ60DRAFT_457848 [Hymenoscyphus varicosporioides]
MMLNSEVACKEFLKTHNAAAIARQLRHDEELCMAQRLPSLLSLYVPSAKCQLAEEIAAELCPNSVQYSKLLRLAQYKGIVQSIKAYIGLMGHASRKEKLPSAAKSRKQYAPSKSDYETTFKVIEFCSKTEGNGGMKAPSSIEELIKLCADQIKNLALAEEKDIPRYPSREEFQKPRGERKCYICQFVLDHPHPQYSSLCKHCGDFNLASNGISLPNKLDLHGKTALVTGGRINLGYHTALRLLRCGAQVIVSTRYPQDSQIRYLAEMDSYKWIDSLRIVGADFRAASDVFHLVDVMKDILSCWSEDGKPKLDILINNAAQTLTDSLEKEGEAVEREHLLLIDQSNKTSGLLCQNSNYQARIRGGVPSSNLLASRENQKSLLSGKSLQEDTHHKDNFTVISSTDNNSQVVLQPKASSWMQSIDEIPYEDIISAHSINTFVPLILIRELLPLMGSLRGEYPAPPANTPQKPLAHIINVSSREGIFESKRNSAAKNGKHVHTNLTKAALNMLTETEAGPAWYKRRVAMNSVDPGYMSAAPEIEKWRGVGERPIGWEDGAGRVLWPVAVGERGESVWGRFLKHFGAREVDVGVGR